MDYNLGMVTRDYNGDKILEIVAKDCGKGRSLEIAMRDCDEDESLKTIIKDCDKGKGKMREVFSSNRGLCVTTKSLIYPLTIVMVPMPPTLTIANLFFQIVALLVTFYFLAFFDLFLPT